MISMNSSGEWLMAGSKTLDKRWDSVDVVRAAPAAGLKWMKTN